MLRKFSVCVLFVTLVLLSSAYALTAKLGNPRVALYPEVNPSSPSYINRNLEVINSNDVPVRVSLNISDNCSELISVKSSENNFVLQPDQSKKVPYLIKVTQPGFYDCKINTYFSEETSGKKGPGVALSAAVIIIAKGKGPEVKDQGNSTLPVKTNSTEDTNSSDGVSVFTGGSSDEDSDKEDSEGVGNAVNESKSNIFLISFSVLMVVVVLLLGFLTIKSKNVSGEGDEAKKSVKPRRVSDEDKKV